MISPISLRISGAHFAMLRNVLFPGDGREHIAFLMCGNHAGTDRQVLLVQSVRAAPRSAYLTQSDLHVSWSTDWLVPLLEEAASKRLSLIKVHSHPGGLDRFSTTDNKADRSLLDAIRNWTEHDLPHGSAVMLPDGKMFGRVRRTNGNFVPLQRISVAGPTIRVWDSHEANAKSEWFASHTMAFGDELQSVLDCLRIGVVGCSGTGSPLIENLTRLGVGELLLVDDDVVEHRNLNRIIHATRQDALHARAKVEVIAKAVNGYGLRTVATPLKLNLASPQAIQSLASCDVVFGCMDTIEGRFLLNMLATHYVIPYFDLGVRIDARPSTNNKPAITEVAATVHYIQPGLSSLLTRGVISMAGVRAEGLRRTDPDAYQEEARSGYIVGVAAQRPGVASLNMHVASLAASDFIGRICPYRQTPVENEAVACIRVSLASLDVITERENGDICPVITPHVGRGDIEPLLGMPMFSTRSAA